MIYLTETAANAVRSAIGTANEPVEGLRIMAESGGCAGYQYSMGLVTVKEPDDMVFEHGDVKVFVDPESMRVLDGTTIDFSVSLEGSGFVFDNPLASSSCSCGKSFS